MKRTAVERAPDPGRSDRPSCPRTSPDETAGRPRRDAAAPAIPSPDNLATAARPWLCRSWIPEKTRCCACRTAGRPCAAARPAPGKWRRAPAAGPHSSSPIEGSSSPRSWDRPAGPARELTEIHSAGSPPPVVWGAAFQAHSDPGRRLEGSGHTLILPISIGSRPGGNQGSDPRLVRFADRPRCGPSEAGLRSSRGGRLD